MRYVGGKSWLVDQLVPRILETKPEAYFEPFVGAGAIALNLPETLPKYLSDNNHRLIDLWLCLQRGHAALFQELQALESREALQDPSEFYLAVRAEFNVMVKNPRTMWPSRSARMLFLNARCFNGLWRTNRAGEFNVPYGKLKSPRHYDLVELKSYSTALITATISCFDFEMALPLGRISQRGHLGYTVFADSPYDGTYDGYSAEGFEEADQRRLALKLKHWSELGAHVFATNADTPLVREIYGSWARLEKLTEFHSVGSTGARRGNRECLLISASPA